MRTWTYSFAFTLYFLGAMFLLHMLPIMRTVSNVSIHWPLNLGWTENKYYFAILKEIQRG